jgi:precorrin-6B methylase 2
MSGKNSTTNRDYWEQNIGGFAKFYDRQSEEMILGPGVVSLPYKWFLFPIERRFMQRRFAMVSEFIDQHVRAGMTVADVGCGSGIFLERIVQKGARVYAVDYTQSAMKLVEEQRLRLGERGQTAIEPVLHDVTKSPIPVCDVALSIGVLTYIDEVAEYFANILPSTKRLLFNFIDSTHFLNRVRRLVPVLNVRRLSYHNLVDIEPHIRKWNHRIVSVRALATGKVVEVERVGA